MTDQIVEIPGIKYGSQRTLGLDTGFRDATADFLRHRWPTNTAKQTARAFDLTLDRAREAVAGRCSLTTLEQIFKRGGFPVALPIVAAVIGQSLARYIRDLWVNHAENGERIAALWGGGRPLPADRHFADPDDALPDRHRRRAGAD
jgi:hypothetical protein